MKAQMSLEYIMKIIILVVVALVIIGMIYMFRNDIVGWWSLFIGSEEEPSDVEILTGNFTNTSVARFIEGCWDLNKLRQEDVNCYFLLGNFSADQNGILSEIDTTIIDASQVVFILEPGFTTLIISYDNYNSVADSEAILLKGMK